MRESMRETKGPSVDHFDAGNRFNLKPSTNAEAISELNPQAAIQLFNPW
jgi:hypothetical protein